MKIRMSKGQWLLLGQKAGWIRLSKTLTQNDLKKKKVLDRMIGSNITVEFYMEGKKTWALGTLEYSSKPYHYVIVIPTGSLRGVSFGIPFVVDIDEVNHSIELKG